MNRENNQHISIDFITFGNASLRNKENINNSNTITNPLNKNIQLNCQNSPSRYTRKQFRKISIHVIKEIISIKKIQENLCQNIKIYCRFKPVRSANIRYDDTMVDDGINKYTFDRIFSQFASQQEVYEKIAKTHIKQFIEGSSTTIFTYGQTSSGKTFTMFGNLQNPKEYGIIPRALNQIFQVLKQKQGEKYLVTCSMLEIYNQKLKDLLGCQKTQLRIKETPDANYVEGLIEVAVQSSEQLIDIINFGHNLRKVAQTHQNDNSSRSHTILIMYLTKFHKTGSITKSKLSLIDLAGSEKVSKTKATGQTLQQAKKINLSLSCLGNVINSLTMNCNHIPYRNSKLTRILKDSLNGCYKTSIITTCSLNKDDLAETISTLKFAVRAKKIKNKPRVNNQQLNLQETVKKLRRQLDQTKKQLAKYKQKYDKQRRNSFLSEIPSEESSLQDFGLYNFSKLIKKHF